jgi:uncharacterized protein (DUF2141 family)
MPKLIFLLLPFWCLPALGQSLEIHLAFSEIRGKDGDLLLSICRNAEEFPYEPFRSVAIPKSKLLQGQELTFTLALPPGNYAIAVLDDENRNGAMDSNWLGIPQEGFAFSNNVRVGLTGPPSFEQCRLQIDTSGFRHHMALNYW